MIAQLEFDREQITDDLLKELPGLLVDNFQEIETYKDMRFEPDIDQYKMAQKMGVIRLFTVREDGRLVGYSTYLVSPHPKFKNKKQAVQDLLYICPELRKGTNGIRFIKWCDKQLVDESVDIIYHSVSVNHDFGKLFERLGYTLVEKVYARRVS